MSSEYRIPIRYVMDLDKTLFETRLPMPADVSGQDIPNFLLSLQTEGTNLILHPAFLGVSI